MPAKQINWTVFGEIQTATNYNMYRVFNAFPLNLTSIRQSPQNSHRPVGIHHCPNTIPTGIPISTAALDNRVYRSDMLWTCGRLQLVVQQIHRRSTGLHTSQPLYRSELISHYLPPRSLRSCNTNLLTRQAGITSNSSSRAFSVSAPSTWNSLPAHIRSIDTISTFKRHLKFRLFHALCLYRPVILCQRLGFVLAIFGAI